MSNPEDLRAKLMPLLARALEGEAAACEGTENPDALELRAAFQCRHTALLARRERVFESVIALATLRHQLGDCQAIRDVWAMIHRENVYVETELVHMRVGERGRLRIAGYYRRELVYAIDDLQGQGLTLSRVARALGIDLALVKRWMREAHDHSRAVERRRAEGIEYLEGVANRLDQGRLGTPDKPPRRVRISKW